MALSLLCLGLILMAQQIKAQNTILEKIQSSVLSKVPWQPDFKDEKFQGKWFTIGGAEIRTQSEGKPVMHRMTYKLQDDHSFNATATWPSEQDCDHWSNIIIPTEKPSQFTISNITSLSGIENFTMTVVATNYHEFAITFYSMITQDKVKLVASLLGRTTVLSSERKEHFVRMMRTLGFTNETIFFPKPMETCL